MAMTENLTRRWNMWQTCDGLPHPSCQASVLIWQTLPVIWFTLGTFGNLLNIIILSRRRMRTSSTTLYLLALSVSDLIFLWTGVMRATLLFSRDFDMKTMSSMNCSLHEWITTTAGSFSIWMLVVLTVERLIYTRKPTTAKVMLTRKNAGIVIIVLFSLFLLCNAHLVYGYRMKPKDEHGNITFNSTGAEQRVCTLVSKEYTLFYKGAYTVFLLLIFDVIPFLIIATGNITVAYTLLAQRRNRTDHSSNSSSSSCSKRLRKVKRNVVAARMLFILSSVFMLTTVPYFVYQIVFHRYGGEMSMATFAHIKLVQAIIYNIFAVNFTFNFFLYFGSGTLFKKELVLMLDELKSKCFKGKEVDNSAINIPMTRPSTQRLIDGSSSQSGSGEANEQVVSRLLFVSN